MSVRSLLMSILPIWGTFFEWREGSCAPSGLARLGDLSVNLVADRVKFATADFPRRFQVRVTC